MYMNNLGLGVGENSWRSLRSVEQMDDAEGLGGVGARRLPCVSASSTPGGGPGLLAHRPRTRHGCDGRQNTSSNSCSNN
ncbi:hypothetical protein KC19_11G060500 [Ceratodon purpureus]|uniref:Uncharacterized protein n=1 Tax=Ceratodon purpureus TaxID=3225 RepID=A0A8T0GH82_CERPU|nr:hypothetical protein KC19_11G060500 [Ceratodon purpureus]